MHVIHVRSGHHRAGMLHDGFRRLLHGLTVQGGQNPPVGHRVVLAARPESEDAVGSGKHVVLPSLFLRFGHVLIEVFEETVHNGEVTAAVYWLSQVEVAAVRKYVALALSSVWVWSCMKPELPPEPPITVVISQCKGWPDAGEPVVAADPTPRRARTAEVEAPPSEPEETVLNP